MKEKLCEHCGGTGFMICQCCYGTGLYSEPHGKIGVLPVSEQAVKIPENKVIK
jgi:hypothetical protein